MGKRATMVLFTSDIYASPWHALNWKLMCSLFFSFAMNAIFREAMFSLCNSCWLTLKVAQAGKTPCSSALSASCFLNIGHGQTDVEHGDTWLWFLTTHNLSEGNILLFRYQGNLVLSVELFVLNGCVKEYNRTPDGASVASSALAIKDGTIRCSM